MTSRTQQLKEDAAAAIHRQTIPAPSPASPVRKRKGSTHVRPRDPNVPQRRLLVNQKCLYERTLPGNTYIAAHVNRLQHGYYENHGLHEPAMDNIYFVCVHFVFHPSDPQSHRFKSAEIKVSVHGDDFFPDSVDDLRYQRITSHPRILKHAPELMFGSVSPKDLQWNFSLSSSLGVSQTPLAASLNPSGGVNGSYKVFHMMSIQGSIRSMKSPFGARYNAEDAMAVWTLEENILQRSGLPREFDFVLLVHRPDDVKKMYLTVDVDTEIDAWFGSYPKFWRNMKKYQPTQDFHLNFNEDIGQRFVPQTERGFNFAKLAHSLDDHVVMPGTVYPTNDANDTDDGSSSHKPTPPVINPHKAIEASPTSPQAPSSMSPPAPQPRTPQRHGMTPQTPQPSRSHHHRQSWAPENMNIRVVLEHQYPQGHDPRGFSYSPLSSHDPIRYPSIRRRKSRSGLKEFSAQQALHELAQRELEDRGYESNEGEHMNDEEVNGQHSSRQHMNGQRTNGHAVNGQKTHGQPTNGRHMNGQARNSL